MGYLHDVHKLVYHDNEALVARADEKRRQQLDVVVPVVVGDNDVYAEILLGLGLGGVLAASHLTAQEAFSSFPAVNALW